MSLSSTTSASTTSSSAFLLSLPAAPLAADPFGEKALVATFTELIRRAATTMPPDVLDALAAARDREDEIERALDEAGAPALKYLEPGRLESLLDRLRALEDCIQTPCDPPDAPPAR